MTTDNNINERDRANGNISGAVSRLLKMPLSRLFYKSIPGKIPGIRPEELRQMESAETANVSCIDYGEHEVKTHDIIDLDDLQKQDRPPGTTVRWINVCGLSDKNIIRQLSIWHGLHPLAIEDILHVPQRPKVETFPTEGPHEARLVIITQMNRLHDDHVMTEQVSICVGLDAVLTFQERSGDVWGPIRERIKQSGARIRLRKTGYLTYALLDAIIDHNFKILEHYGLELEQLEERVLDGPSGNIISQIHAMKRELLLLRRQVWPMREIVHTLQREEHECISEETRLYLRDAYDHAVQVLDVVETYREVASEIADTHMTVVGNRMNEVMKTLTMVASVFIPISFLAGVFGMNFDDVPGLHFRGAFVVFCLACCAAAGTMVMWFRRKGWW